MNRKIAAILLAATMLTMPAFGASVVRSPNTSTAQTVDPDKVTKTSDKGANKHRVHAHSSHGHKVRHAKHAKPNQVRAHKISKKSVGSAGLKSHTKTVAAAPAKVPAKN